MIDLTDVNAADLNFEQRCILGEAEINLTLEEYGLELILDHEHNEVLLADRRELRYNSGEEIHVHKIL